MLSVLQVYFTFHPSPQETFRMGPPSAPPHKSLNLEGLSPSCEVSRRIRNSYDIDFHSPL